MGIKGAIIKVVNKGKQVIADLKKPKEPVREYLKLYEWAMGELYHDESDIEYVNKLYEQVVKDMLYAKEDILNFYDIDDSIDLIDYDELYKLNCLFSTRFAKNEFRAITHAFNKHDINILEIEDVVGEITNSKNSFRDDNSENWED